jgi:hypothetical protein
MNERPPRPKMKLCIEIERDINPPYKRFFKNFNKGALKASDCSTLER